MSEPTLWQPAAAGAPAAPPAPLSAPAAPSPAGPDGTGTWSEAASPPARGRRPGVLLKVTNIIWLCVLALVMVGTLAYFAGTLGASVFLVCGALALIPLGFCVATLVWIDRWEPEPVPALIVAFCWGAGTAVVTALLLGSWVQPLFMGGGSPADADMLGAVIQAPLVEELCKGTGLLLLFFLRRRTFDGPVDGLVHAGLIAAGFAFTENILYFGQALQKADGATGGLLGIFVVRGMLSPFAHVMFTATLGICVGWAARHGGTPLVLGAWVAGLLPAMALHGLWNATSFLGAAFFVVYVVLQVPLFILFILGIILLRRAEARLTRQRLGEYVAPGWFTPQEVPMLATGAGRRRALAWSKTFAAGPLMKEFIRLATRLAFVRQRLIVDAKAVRGVSGAARFAEGQEREARLLADIVNVRHELLACHRAALPR